MYADEFEGLLYTTLSEQHLNNQIINESFQLQMGFSFLFLRANDLRLSSLNIRARSF